MRRKKEGSVCGAGGHKTGTFSSPAPVHLAGPAVAMATGNNECSWQQTKFAVSFPFIHLFYSSPSSVQIESFSLAAASNEGHMTFCSSSEMFLLTTACHVLLALALQNAPWVSVVSPGPAGLQWETPRVARFNLFI